MNSQIIDGRYRILAPLATGGFGIMYRGECLVSGINVAIKVEAISKTAVLQHEYDVYRSLSGWQSVPRVHYFGQHENYNVLVLDMLGPSLTDLSKHCNGRFTVKTTAMLGDQLFLLLEHLHSSGIVHRDIKPSNLLMGVDAQINYLYLVDFGLASPYLDSAGHIEYSKNKRFLGSLRYASINAHRGIVLSRRDDLQSAIYTLLFLVRGSLPWQSISGGNVMQRVERICESKESFTGAMLCRGLPMELLKCYEYCHSMGFKQKPDYDGLRLLLRLAMQRNNLQYDFLYDWKVLRLTQMIEESDNSPAESHETDSETYPPA